MSRRITEMNQLDYEMAEALAVRLSAATDEQQRRRQEGERLAEMNDGSRSKRESPESAEALMGLGAEYRAFYDLEDVIASVDVRAPRPADAAALEERLRNGRLYGYLDHRFDEQLRELLPQLDVPEQREVVEQVCTQLRQDGWEQASYPERALIEFAALCTAYELVYQRHARCLQANDTLAGRIREACQREAENAAKRREAVRACIGVLRRLQQRAPRRPELPAQGSISHVEYDLLPANLLRGYVLPFRPSHAWQDGFDETGPDSEDMEDRLPRTYLDAEGILPGAAASDSDDVVRLARAPIEEEQA